MILRLTLFLSAILFSMSFTGCSSSPKKETHVPTAKEQTVYQQDSDRNAYVAATQSRIDEIARLSNNLIGQSAQSNKVTAKKMQNASEDLNSLLNDVRRELNDVRTALPQNWVDEKRDVEKTLSRAETQYSNSVQLLQ
jgi:uncharacterized protein YukE